MFDTLPGTASIYIVRKTQIRFSPEATRRLDNSVGIVTSPRAGRSEARIPAGENICLFSRNFRTGHTDHTASFSMGIARAERDGTRAETRFLLSPKRTSPFNLLAPEFGI